jgi:hypothetical protein
MSAWLVFTALGFYPVDAGVSLQYVIGRPFVTARRWRCPTARASPSPPTGSTTAIPISARSASTGGR